MDMGWWDLAKSSKVQRLVSDLDAQYSDFEGRLLRVSANNEYTFFKQRTLDDGSLAPWEGLDVDIVRVLANIYNFTWEVVHPADGMWGGPQPDGSITGLIGLVARHEAQFSICELSVTAERETVVDFSTPYFFEGSTIASRAPSVQNQSLAVITPYTWRVWLLIFGSIFVVGIAMYFIQRGSPREMSPSENVFVSFTFNTFRSLVVQGNKSSLDSWALRVIVTFWMLACVIVSALYSGTLVAMFATVTLERPIDNLLDLLEEAKKGNVYPTVTQGTSIHFFFEKATSGTHKELYQYFDPDKSYVDDTESYAKTAEGKAVVLVNAVRNFMITNSLGRGKYHISTQELFPQAYGMALPEGSPYRDNFSKTLIRLSEVGLIQKWIQTALRNELRYSGVTGGGEENVLPKRRKGNSPINLEQLTAAFYILAAGFILSILALLSELFLERVISLY